MLAALECAGLRVFVWTPEDREKLIPWRKFVRAQKDANYTWRTKREKNREMWASMAAGTWSR